jgi:hydrogenase maturation factor
LFFSLSGNEAQNLVEKMRGAGISDATVVGEVVKDHPGKIFVY